MRFRFINLKQENIEIDNNKINVLIASSFISRLMGLISVSSTELNKYGIDGVLFENCKSVHTYGMKEKIEIVFFDSKGAIIRVFPQALPRKVYFASGAKHVLEIFSNSSFILEQGMNLNRDSI